MVVTEGDPVGALLFPAFITLGLMLMVPGLVLVFTGQKKISKTSTINEVFCATCQKWFAVTRVAKVRCPNCRTPLEWRIQCEWCGKWCYSSDPKNEICPKCIVGP